MTARPSQAAEICTPLLDSSLLCTSTLDIDRLLSSVETQENDQWCWAASIAIIFGHHGFSITQAEIVQQTFGAVVNRPAGSGMVISLALNQTYVDADGMRFRGRTVVHDMQARHYGLTNTMIAWEINQGNPLLVGSQGHAMVLVGLTYRRFGPQVISIDSATVYDPWPGRGFRNLDLRELLASYVALVRVEREERDPDEALQSAEDAHQSVEGAIADHVVSLEVRPERPRRQRRRALLDSDLDYHGFVIMRLGSGLRSVPLGAAYNSEPGTATTEERLYKTYSAPFSFALELALADTEYFGFQIGGQGYASVAGDFAYGGSVGSGIWGGLRAIGAHVGYNSEWRHVEVNKTLTGGAQLKREVSYRLDAINFGLRSCWGDYFSDEDGGCAKVGALWHKPNYVDRQGHSHAWGAVLDVWHSFGLTGLGIYVEMAGPYPIAASQHGIMQDARGFRSLSVTALLQASLKFSWGG